MLLRAVVVTTHSSLGGVGTNTWHLRTSGPIPGAVADATGLMDIVKTFYESISAAYPTGVAVTCDGQLSGVGPDEGEFVAIPAWSGTLAGGLDPLPPANTIVVNWRGQSGDRSRRGRTFVGPLNVGVNAADGTPNLFTLTAFRDAAAALVASSSGFDNGALGVWSRQESLFRDFVASSVSNQFSVLRSRRD